MVKGRASRYFYNERMMEVQNKECIRLNESMYDLG